VKRNRRHNLQPGEEPFPLPLEPRHDRGKNQSNIQEYCDGEGVVAWFPELPTDVGGRECVVYNSIFKYEGGIPFGHIADQQVIR